ncbi:MAG: GntR family transcriptional regulator [Abditibacteriota bacterium]|nr:GntR family transcriptional regulator [Abditibacteriota bacterium]
MKKEQIVKFIMDQISSGKWEEGTKIYSEYQFKEMFKVSSGTVRSAIKELSDKHILKTIHGSGSYVLSSKEKKSILILTNQTIAYLINSNYRKLLDLLKEEIYKKGYTPICYANSGFTLEETLTDKIKDIAGIIAVYPDMKDLYSLKRKNIPIVNAIQSYPCPEPTVLINWERFFQTLKKLIKKYNFRKISVIGPKTDMEKSNIKEEIHGIVLEHYFQKYDFNTADYNNEAEINKIITRYKTPPELIIFLDDNQYKLALPTIKANKSFFENTKIITEYSYLGSETEPNTCKICFNLNQIAKEGVNLLVNLINKETINDYNVFIHPTVENEEALMK